MCLEYNFSSINLMIYMLSIFTMENMYNTKLEGSRKSEIFH